MSKRQRYSDPRKAGQMFNLARKKHGLGRRGLQTLLDPSSSPMAQNPYFFSVFPPSRSVPLGLLSSHASCCI